MAIILFPMNSYGWFTFTKNILNLETTHNYNCTYLRKSILRTQLWDNSERDSTHKFSSQSHESLYIFYGLLDDG